MLSHTSWNRSAMAWLAVSVPLLVVAATPLFATTFAFMQTDDYCTFGRLLGEQGGNPVAETYFLYQHWTGRYSSSLLIAVVGAMTALLPAPIVYTGALAGFLLLFGVACFQATRLPSIGDKTAAFLTLLVFSSTLLLMPSKLEQYLWLTGAAVYFVGGSLLLLLVDRLAGTEPPGHARPWGETYVAILIVLIVGFNEFLAIIVGGALLWSFSERRARGQPWKRDVLRLIVFSAAFAATILAPGNFARDAASSVPRHDVLEASRLALSSAHAFFSGMIDGHLVSFIGSLVAAVLAGLLAPRVPQQRPWRAWLPYLALLVAAFPMHLWVYSFLTGEPTPGRIINQAFMLMHVAASILLFALAQRLAMVGGARRVAGFTALGLASLAVASSGTYREFASVVNGFAPRWHEGQLRRHEALLALSGTSDPVYVRPYPLGDSYPPTFQGGDVGHSSEHWINRCVADYYDVPAITLLRRPVVPTPPPR